MTALREQLIELMSALAGSPHLQGLVAGLSTLVLEDPTTIGCGLLVAEHHMAFATAMIGLSAGIAAGDLGLYGLGRAVGPRVLSAWGLVPADRLARASLWFERNLVAAVLLSRFVPGMRLPTYVGAGVLSAPLGRFIAVVVCASLVWTFILLRLTVAVGERVLPLLGDLRWPVAGVALLVLVLAQRRAARTTARPGGSQGALSRFELWPPWLFYIPVVLYWLWLALRHRSLTLPTAANPSIYSGGFIGESKAEILDLVPAEQRRWIATYAVLDRGEEAPEKALERARRVMTRAGLDYPVVAKPDIGQRGDGVQPIYGDDELVAYLRAFPAGHRLLLQELVAGGGGSKATAADRPPWWPDVREAGVLYYRLPGQRRGQVFSITFKLLPEVVGDGSSTLAELVDADPRAHHLRDLYLARHRATDRVLERGERVPLVFAGNHCQGAVFKNGTPYLTVELSDRIHEIAAAIPGFYFGRFDVRCDSADALLAGDGFRIVEINGASAEATHIWDASTGLVRAYVTLFEQLRILFAIGAANRRLGHRPLGVLLVIADALAYRRAARSYPHPR